MKKYKDEIQVKMITSLGQSLGEMLMPKKMKQGLIRAYMESGAVRTWYLYIDGKEITDGKNYNPYIKIIQKLQRKTEKSPYKKLSKARQKRFIKN